MIQALFRIRVCPRETGDATMGSAQACKQQIMPFLCNANSDKCSVCTCEAPAVRDIPRACWPMPRCLGQRAPVLQAQVCLPFMTSHPMVRLPFMTKHLMGLLRGLVDAIGKRLMKNTTLSPVMYLLQTMGTMGSCGAAECAGTTGRLHRQHSQPQMMQSRWPPSLHSEQLQSKK